MALGVKAAFEVQKELEFGDIDAFYTQIGTASTNPCRILFIDNFTDAPLQFSMDGVNDHFVVWGPGSKALDVTGNRSSSADELYFKAATQVYVKTLGDFEDPTSGSVYISFVYGDN